MPPHSSDSAKAAEAPTITPDRGAPLEPIRVVKRELSRPDGTRVIVEVPVYPAFELRRPPTHPEPNRRRKLGGRR